MLYQVSTTVPVVKNVGMGSYDTTNYASREMNSKRFCHNRYLTVNELARLFAIQGTGLGAVGIQLR